MTVLDRLDREAVAIAHPELLPLADVVNALAGVLEVLIEQVDMLTEYLELDCTPPWPRIVDVPGPDEYPMDGEL